jgi:hypothetical protein
MATGKDGSRDDGKLDGVIDLNWRLPPPPMPRVGPPAPESDDGQKRSVGPVEPPRLNENGVRISGTSNPKDGSASITLGSDIGSVTLRDSSSGQTFNGQVKVPFDKDGVVSLAGEVNTSGNGSFRVGFEGEGFRLGATSDSASPNIKLDASGVVDDVRAVATLQGDTFTLNVGQKIARAFLRA